MTRRDPVSGHEDVAIAIVDSVNVYGREYPLRWPNEELLIAAIASALQDAFDCGFRAAGGTITPLATVSLAGETEKSG
jgi:hypothetical protein